MFWMCVLYLEFFPGRKGCLISARPSDENVAVVRRVTDQLLCYNMLWPTPTQILHFRNPIDEVSYATGRASRMPIYFFSPPIFGG